MTTMTRSGAGGGPCSAREAHPLCLMTLFRRSAEHVTGLASLGMSWVRRLRIRYEEAI